MIGSLLSGVGCTAVGLAVIIVTVIAYRKMSGAAPIKVNTKVVGKVVYGVVSSLVLGLGMAMVRRSEMGAYWIAQNELYKIFI